MNKTIAKVALIGRANVGKSTLFNKLTDQKKALISTIPGTTRDRNYAEVSWNNGTFMLIDTGGLDVYHNEAFKKEIVKQTGVALAEADAILFMVNKQEGLMPQDKEVARLIRKFNKPVIMVVNKADTPKHKKDLSEYYRLGFKEVMAISALNGSGTGDLLDKVVELTNKLKIKPYNKVKNYLRLAIIGKPNVGKSSLVNSVLGEERTITSPTAFTTRDANEISWRYKNQDFLLIDTAGVRRHNKINDPLEKISVKQTLKTIEEADVVLFMTDASEPLTNQDQQLANFILAGKSSIIIVANKWDLIENKDEKTINKFRDYYYKFMPFLDYAPLVFTSTVNHKRITDVLDLALKVYEARFKKIDDEILDKFLRTLLKKHLPGKGRGVKKPKLFQLKQLAVNPPEFELVKDFQSDLHPSYLRFAENQLRKEYGFLGAPIIFKMRKLAK